MAKILKLWHEWSWALHICVWLVVGTALVVTYRDAITANASDIERIDSGKLPERMAVQEQLSRDTGERLTRMENVQGKIFERINQIADRRP